MIILDKIIEKKKKKEYDIELTKNQIILSSVSLKKSGSEKSITGSRFFLCLVRALLIFLCAFGTVGAATSSFGLSYKPLIVLPLSLFICIFIAFIYYNKKTFYIGYTLYFILFAFFIFNLYWYVNSGYQAFINTVYEKYSDYFRLQSTREASEFISDRTLTVSVTMVFIVAFLALLLNITISGYMSMIETFLLTFPLIQLGLYIDEKPKLVYMVMLISSYITILVIGRSSHFKIPDIGKKVSEYQSIYNKRKKTKYHSYTANGTSLLINTLLSLAFVSAFLLVTNAVFYSDTGVKYVTNKLKNTSDEYIKNFVQSGPWSFFDRYASTGGLSKGMLGGVGSIRPDYETDLEITFVPQSTDTLYLKAFMGTHYTKDHFYTNRDDLYNDQKIKSFKNMYSISDYIPLTGDTSKMVVKNIDADQTYNYMPYYTAMSGDEHIEQGVAEYTTYFYPYESLIKYSSEIAPDNEYEQYVHDTFLEVPEYSKEYLEEFISNTEMKAIDPSKDIQSQILGNAAILKKIFAQDYSYTMAPGSTPRNQDFVEYFLSKQKRGFCAHFAASSTLILRELNIPCRYVEGYCVSLSEIANATAVSQDITGWVGNPDRLRNMDTGVVNVEVTDGSAHAWVEIYIDGYGWIPYDFTPPSSDDTLDDFNFSSLFSGLFMTLNSDNTDSNNNSVNNNQKHYSLNINGSLGFVGIPFIIVLCTLILSVIVYRSLSIVRELVDISKSEKAGAYNKALSIRYTQFIRVLKAKQNNSDCWTLRDLEDYVNKCIESNPKNPHIDTRFFQIINQALYSDLPITEQEYQIGTETLKNLNKIKK